MTPEELRSLLKGTSLFAGFNDEQLDVVPKVARRREFEPGTVIVSQGDTEARSFWLILEGEVEVRAGATSLASLGAGDYFGEMSLLTDAPRSADVVAIQPTTVLELAQSHLRGLIHSDPDVGLAIAASLSSKLRWLTERVATLVRSSPEAAAAARDVGIVAGDAGPDTRMGPVDSTLTIEDGSPDQPGL